MTDQHIDMGPFFARHDRTTRRTFVAAIAVSLAVSAGSIGYAALAAGAPRPVATDLWVLMAVVPVVLIAFRMALMRWGGKRPHLPDGSLPMNADDARSAMRVANAGGLFVAGVGMAMIATQASVALGHFEALAPWAEADEWLGRAGLAGMGALMIYFGNAWPMMPTPRAPDKKPATHKTFNRRYGWIVVTAGVLFVLAALQPSPAMPLVVAGACHGLVLAVTAITVGFYRAMKSPDAT